MDLLTWAVAAAVVDDRGRVLLCRLGRPGCRWSLPGGRLHRPEDPTYAVTRRIRSAIGLEIAVVDLVGIYHLTGAEPAVLVHVFRARSSTPVTGAANSGSARVERAELGWWRPVQPPETVTPVTRAVLADLRAGHSGMVRRIPHEPPQRPERSGPGVIPGARTAPPAGADGASTMGPVAG